MTSSSSNTPPLDVVANDSNQPATQSAESVAAGVRESNVKIVKREYGVLTFKEWVQLVFWTGLMPIHVFFHVISTSKPAHKVAGAFKRRRATTTIHRRRSSSVTSSHSSRNSLPRHVQDTHVTGKSWRRRASEEIARFSTARLPLFAPQVLLQSSQTVYERWAATRNLPTTVDILLGADEARLLWIGPKPACLRANVNLGSGNESVERRRTEEAARLPVIMFIHGGGFVYPMADIANTFLLYVKQELEARLGTRVGVCALAYNLIPNAAFPIPLRDACSGIRFLLESGVQPGRLQLLGESAGGTILLHVLRHLAKPHSVVGRLVLGEDNVEEQKAELAGICVISPGLPMQAGDPFMAHDILTRESLEAFSRLVSEGVHEMDREWVYPPEESLRDMTGRLMVTTGTGEMMHAAQERLRATLVTAPGLQLTWLRDRGPGGGFEEDTGREGRSGGATDDGQGGLHCGPVFDFPMGVLAGDMAGAGFLGKCHCGCGDHGEKNRDDEEEQSAGDDYRDEEEAVGESEERRALIHKPHQPTAIYGRKTPEHHAEISATTTRIVRWLGDGFDTTVLA
ncbi:alpha/beta-hydrolase [Cylindrobasidium torrendii FP15055 ss-10]|uniref:Alpha/beta-hydrolase n=1 Tax=Cylindrobasidium torrendii FP15055 ss-10 TaxID=1314674 RepID=A0A0D7BVA1_9AGAR|nr:alpha/beta-hydrolase [Cylindrobasidium torrendii FP15055 ss-10]